MVLIKKGEVKRVSKWSQGRISKRGKGLRLRAVRPNGCYKSVRCFSVEELS